jgi:hypothetical protein
MSSESNTINKEENINNKSAQNNKNQQEKKNKLIYLDGLGGFFLLIVIILVNIAAIITLIIFLNFLIDSKKYNFDFIGLTRLGKNTHFSLCSIFSCIDSWYSSFIFNLIIIFILLFQEVVMSSKWVRLTFIKRAMGDMLFYPKYVIRFMTFFNFCMLHMLYQPMNFDDIEVYPKLYLTDYFHPIFLLIPLISGLYLIFSSLYFNLYLNDELGIFLFIKIIKGHPIDRLGDFLYGYNIYGRIRSPFRGGMMLILLGFSPKWDLGRALYTTLFWFALYIEGINDDRYYFEKYDAYKEYLRQVPCRFFDLSFITGKRKKKVEIHDEEKEKKEKEEKKEEPSRRRRNKKKQE